MADPDDQVSALQRLIAQLEEEAADLHDTRRAHDYDDFSRGYRNGQADRAESDAEHLKAVLAVVRTPQSNNDKTRLIGGGKRPFIEDDSQRTWRCGCYEDQGGYHLCLDHAASSRPPSSEQKI